MIHDLFIRFMLTERTDYTPEGLPVSADKGSVYSDLDRGAEFIEPALFADRDERRLNHLLGQTAFLSGLKMSFIPLSYFAGFVEEHNHHEETVIALRRMTARGA